MDQFLQWYNRLPAKNIMVAVVAAFAFVAAFQTFASSGEYQASPDSGSTSSVAWSAPGRYFLDCKPVETGEKCLNPPKDETAVYAKGKYTASYQTIELPAGAYTLKLKYMNVGPVPPNYSYNANIMVNGKPISAGKDGAVSLATTGSQPWAAEFPVTLPGGVTTISLDWTNDLSGETGADPNFGIEQLSLVSKQATEAAAKHDDQRRQDLNKYQDALARYVVDNGNYPIQSSVQGMTGSNEPFASLKGKYMDTFLTDPSTGHAYYFVSSGSRYGLCADLESDPGVRYEIGPSGSRQTRGPAKECGLLN